MSKRASSMIFVALLVALLFTALFCYFIEQETKANTSFTASVAAIMVATLVLPYRLSVLTGGFTALSLVKTTLAQSQFSITQIRNGYMLLFFILLVLFSIGWNISQSNKRSQFVR